MKYIISHLHINKYTKSNAYYYYYINFFKHKENKINYNYVIKNL